MFKMFIVYLKTKRMSFLNIKIQSINFFQVIMILSYFGGLRHVELTDLNIEMVEKKPDGMYVTHSRAKQRTDKRNSKFLVASNGDVDYAQVVDKN